MYFDIDAQFVALLLGKGYPLCTLIQRYPFLFSKPDRTAMKMDDPPNSLHRRENQHNPHTHVLSCRIYRKLVQFLYKISLYVETYDSVSIFVGWECIVEH